MLKKSHLYPFSSNLDLYLNCHELKITAGLKMMTRTHGTEDISIRFQFRMNYAINMGCNPYCKKSPWMVWAPQTDQQLISSFEYRPDGTVLLRQPSLVILLAHFWRWRRNSTSHSLSSPTSSPYPHPNAGTAPRGELASSNRFLGHHSLRTGSP